jgi:imidazolonepropionase-like amidohydrolase
MHDARSFVLRAANVFDEGGSFGGPLDVHVADGVVTAVGTNRRAVDAPNIDCSGLWLLPGFFDCHTHLAMSSFDALEALRRPITRWALEAAANARATLEGGVTFVRDAAGFDLGLKQSIDDRLVPGPRTQISVTGLSQTGGHGDGFLAGPGLELSSEYLVPEYPGRPPYLVDGPEPMRLAVRQVLRAGGDWIKVMATGGILSPHDEATAPQFTREELDVAVAESAAAGKGVMAHAYGGAGLDNAVAAGVRSIEHGTFLTEAQAAAMAAADCWLVPTLSVLSRCVDWAKDGTLPEHARAKALEVGDRLGEAVTIAREHGVRVACGTDSVHRSQHGRNLGELLHLHRAGLTVEETLLAGTAWSAELCGVADRYGRVAPGYVFDAVLVDDDPSDLAALAAPGAVTGVFLGGRPAVAHTRLTG